jgi:cytoskeleton protein RodZ
MNEGHSMTNQDTQGVTSVSDTGGAVSASALTAGAMLRQAREANGLHIAALAVTMKVPVKKLEALESDRLDLLPDAVFARALASSVCRTLKVDANPILERLPHTKKVNLTVEARAANEPFNAAGYSSANHASLSVGKTATILVSVLLLGVALILLVPDSEKSVPVPEEVSIVPGVVEPTEKVAEGVEEVVVPWGTAQPAANLENPVANPSSVLPSEASAAPTSVPVSGSPATNVAPAASLANATIPPNQVIPSNEVTNSAGTPPQTASSNPVVMFKTRGESWIEVVDAKGVLQMRRKMLENETASVGGALPLQVVVGRADVTEVSVRGQAFDTSKVSQGNVARFEVR